MRQKVPPAPLNQQDYISALFFLSRLLHLLSVPSSLNRTRAISFRPGSDCPIKQSSAAVSQR